MSDFYCYIRIIIMPRGISTTKKNSTKTKNSTRAKDLKPKKNILNVRVKVDSNSKKTTPREEIFFDSNQEYEKNSDNLRAAEYYSDSLNDTEERRKFILMWSGVMFFMILIGGFWIYNTSKVFKIVEQNNTQSEFLLADWSKMADDVSAKIEELKKETEEIKNLNLENATSTIVSTTTVDIVEDNGVATSSASSTNEILEIQKELIQNIQKVISSSSQNNINKDLNN